MGQVGIEGERGGAGGYIGRERWGRWVYREREVGQVGIEGERGGAGG